MPQRFSPTPGGCRGGHSGVRAVAQGLLLALLCGCSIFQPEAPESPAPELPTDFNTHLEGASLAVGDWVDDFDDPQLEALVEEALNHNNKFLSALSKRDAASAQYAAAFAGRLPRLDLQAQAQRQKFINDIVRSSSVDIEPVVYPTRLILGAGVNWELDLWGRVANQANAARDEAAAAILDVQAASFSLAAQTATQWFALVAAQKRLALAQRVAESYGETVKRSEERYERGLVTVVDLRQAMAESEGAQGELLGRQIELGRTRRALEVLLGRYPSNELEVAGSLPALPPAVAAGVPGQLIERRPDVAAAELRLRASDQRLLGAKKNLLPRFSISLSAGTQAKYRDLLFTDDSEIWSIGGNAVMPLFDGGATRAGIQAQRSLMEDSVAQFQDKVLSACLEVEDALAAELLIRDQVQRSRNAVEQTLAVEDSISRRFELGLVDLRAVLAARRSRWQAEQRVLETELLALNNRIGLYLALGGGIAEPGDDDTDTTDAEPDVADDQAEDGAEAAIEMLSITPGTDEELPSDPTPAWETVPETEPADAAAPEVPVEFMDPMDHSTMEPTEPVVPVDEAVEVPVDVPASAVEPEPEPALDPVPAEAVTGVPAADAALSVSEEPVVEPMEAVPMLGEPVTDEPPSASEDAELEAARQRNLESLLATDPVQQ